MHEAVEAGVSGQPRRIAAMADVAAFAPEVEAAAQAWRRRYHGEVEGEEEGGEGEEGEEAEEGEEGEEGDRREGSARADGDARSHGAIAAASVPMARAIKPPSPPRSAT